MLKVGFIDYYLSEWHADNLPTWLREETKGEVCVAYAWAKIDAPQEGRKTNAQWAAEQGVELLSSIEEVIEKSDVLVVLSPDNPEMHEELCDLPLKSGKRTYVDKTFAPSFAVAKKLVQIARDYNTPMFTSSALRFSTELQGIDTAGISAVSSQGPGPWEIYCIHQIEPIVKLMGPEAEQVMFIGNDVNPGMVIRFSGNRFATMQHFDWSCPFKMTVGYPEGKEDVKIPEMTDYFPNFVKELVDFFRGGAPKAPLAETLAVAAIREAALAGKKTPGVWMDLPKER